MPTAKTPSEARHQRIEQFQKEIDALPKRGYEGVIEVGTEAVRGTIEYRGGGLGWEAQRGGGHVGMFWSAGEAVNALWEIDPWTMRPRPQAILCDICGQVCKESYVDGKTAMGPWAQMCTSCHSLVGLGLGTGRGQRFSTVTGRKLEG